MASIRIYPQYDTNSPAPAGNATAANQIIGNSSLNSIDVKTPALGQHPMTGSTSVVFASDQPGFPMSLPAGASTSAKQDTGNTSLNNIDTKTPALGQALMAASVPVTISSNQPSLSVTATLAVVDQIDGTPLLDTSLSNIPASASNSLQVVASLAAAVKKVISVEDIGEFFGLYSGAVSSPTLLCILPLGGGEMEVTIPAGTLVSIRNMKNAAVSSGFIAINFLG